MSIGFLYAAALLALGVLLARPALWCAIRLLEWDTRRPFLRERRRQRLARRGFVQIPIFDDQWEPERELANWPRINDGTYLQIPRRRHR